MSIKEKFLKKVTDVKLWGKANYPKLCVIGGVTILVGAGVYACVQTSKKMDAIKREHAENVQMVKDLKEKFDKGEEVVLENGEEYTKDTYQKQLFTAYATTAKAVIKTYAPPVALALLGTFLIFFGHNTTEKRYVKAAAESYMVHEAFRAYRDRVAERFGKQVEQEIFVNGEHKLVTEEETDPETGETKNVTKDTLVSKKTKDSATQDIYCYIFDEANCPTTWERRPGWNYSFLIQMQHNANEYLRMHGAITLYEVLKQLGYTDIPADTMRLGWMIDNPTGYGDGFVDFGIANLSGTYDDVGCFSGGLPDYVLNFNCDGDIMSALKIKQERDKEIEKQKRAKRSGKTVQAVVKKTA